MLCLRLFPIGIVIVGYAVGLMSDVKLFGKLVVKEAEQERPVIKPRSLHSLSLRVLVLLAPWHVRRSRGNLVVLRGISVN